MTNEELENLLVKSKIRFDDEDWIKKTVQEHFNIKKEFFKEYFEDVEDYNKCISQLKMDLELSNNVKLV
jgi:formiminotetrahydrofolate cyclodeaminase